MTGTWSRAAARLRYVLAEHATPLAATPAPRAAHIAGTLAWLLRAHDATADDGVAAGYQPARRIWFPSYPETTGYKGTLPGGPLARRRAHRPHAAARRSRSRDPRRGQGLAPQHERLQPVLLSELAAKFYLDALLLEETLAAGPAAAARLAASLPWCG